jgi:hypothetical protein
MFDEVLPADLIIYRPMCLYLALERHKSQKIPVRVLVDLLPSSRDGAGACETHPLHLNHPVFVSSPEKTTGMPKVIVSPRQFSVIGRVASGQTGSCLRCHRSVRTMSCR